MKTYSDKQKGKSSNSEYIGAAKIICAGITQGSLVQKSKAQTADVKYLSRAFLA